MGDYHVLGFKLNFTGIIEELHFASRASKLYLNDLKQVNTTWMINAYVGEEILWLQCFEGKTKHTQCLLCNSKRS